MQESHRLRARAVACAILFAFSCAGAKSAGAAPIATLDLDWERLAEALRTGAGIIGHGRESASDPRDSSSAAAEKTPGLSPNISLVARDWGGAEALFGRVAVTDLVRLSRSSRMVISRIRFLDGRITPFVELGLGQWRVDTDLMPVLPRDTELAAQVGGGLELRVWSRFAIALEIDHTVLYREQHEPQMLAAPHLWGSFVGARAVF